MKTNVTGRKLSLRPSFVEKTEKKLSKLDKFFEDDARADVTVKQEGNGFKVETTIHNQGMVYRAEEAAPDMVEALDKLIDKLVRQIRKNKTRLEKRLRGGSICRASSPRGGGNGRGVRCGALQVLPGQAAGRGGSHPTDESAGTSVLYVPQHGFR